jgi:hypothetical protein
MALMRADVETIRFAVGLSLVEWTLFWARARDGQGVRTALRNLAGYTPEENAWGSGFATRLATCAAMRAVDKLPIFLRSPSLERHPLLSFSAIVVSPSDVRNWALGQPEKPHPIPGAPRPQKAADRKIDGVPAVRPEQTPEQRFAKAFLAVVRETLDQPTVDALEQFTKERLEGTTLQ